MRKRRLEHGLVGDGESGRFGAQGSQHLLQAPECKPRLGLNAPGRQDAHLALLGEPDRLAEQPRLADARIASQDKGSARVLDIIKKPGQDLDLSHAAEQRRQVVRQRPHRTAMFPCP